MTAWFALALGIAMQAVITALLGLSLTPADSLMLLMLAALICTVSGRLFGPQTDNAGETADLPNSVVLRLNLWTAVMFVAFFLGVATHGAPVVFTLEATLAPIAVLAWRSLTSEHRATRFQWALAAVLAALGAGIVTLLAHNTFSDIRALLTASALGVAAAVAAAGVIVISRELGRTGVDARKVVGRRFVATLAITSVAQLILIPVGLIEPPSLHFGVAAGAALASIVVPIYLLQFAMHRLSPTTITAGLATIPALTFATEFLVGHQVEPVAVLLSIFIMPASLALLRAETQGPQQQRNRKSEQDDRSRRSGIDRDCTVSRVHRVR
ncbi:hypothetical protein ACTXG7_19595 [Mycolicibacterium sp. Dal123E01]|uniref:hypothetical protein n=1 Tax=Mycolicibacterium sp. Dal123E01 TaxID=3457578 RepID=UPI00403E7C51